MSFLDGLRLRALEEPVVFTDGCLDGVRGLDPVDCALDLSSIGGVSALGIRVVCAPELHHISGGVLDHLLALDEISPAEPDLPSRRQPEVLRRGDLLEVILFDE